MIQKLQLAIVGNCAWYYFNFYITATCFGRVELTSTDGLSRYTASWRGRRNRVEFELTGRGQGWVGIGFSENRISVIILLLFQHIINSVTGQSESDMIVGGTDGSDFFVDDR